MNLHLRKITTSLKSKESSVSHEKEFYLSLFRLFAFFLVLILVLTISLSYSQESEKRGGSERVVKTYSGKMSEELKRRNNSIKDIPQIKHENGKVKYQRLDYPLKDTRANLSISQSSESLELYGTQYLDIWTDETYSNAYDPDNISVDAILTSPEGNLIAVPAFHKSGTSGNSHWEVRFTPREIGNYSYYIEIIKDGYKSSSETNNFNVYESEKDGFLHVDKSNYYSLQFDSEKRFRGVGQNFGWEGNGYSYDNMYPKMADNGINFFRTWMCPFNNMLEWGGNGPTNYNMSAAENWDDIISQAEDNGIYIMLTLDYHGVFVTQPDFWGGNNYWSENPYNSNNGGMCWSPADFFTNSNARNAYKKRLRYIIARWGYSSSIAVIEFFNEIDHAINNENVNVADVVNWHEEMGSYLKSIDPYNHIVSTSVSHEYYPDLWNVSSIDITQRHLYGSGGSHVTDNLYNEIKSWNDAYGKPFVAGEFGYDWKSPAEINDNASYTRELRLGLWRGMFSPTPIIPMTWWWDFHEPWGDFILYKAASQFNEEFLSNVSDEIREVNASTNSEIEIMALAGGDVYAIWMRNRMNYLWGEGEITLAEIKNGTYSINYYNTKNGEIETIEDEIVSNGSIKIFRPQLESDEDVACIVKLKKDPVNIALKNVKNEFLSIHSLPQNGQVQISLSDGGTVEIMLYSSNGKLIKEKVLNNLVPGNHFLKFTNKPLSKQVYFVRCKVSGKAAITKKVMWNN